ncbi:YidC/Oxa1 family membrane protein insertase [Sporomusa sp.]|uniref:YidC/Oxa1 family membrane protein insertase n=1 Tax=Sporomusa sp. TaxID=2078658 RepID=UPI002BD17E84|nr:YidC/Oxa1 family membrane protein insertase [Sporomusa sp.]HWR44034.1 YidC/Oxa1 family membrane protein insertase [Sporomusa sp.]
MQSALTFFYNMTASIGFANYGIAIILLTIAIKALMYPLTVKQVKSMKAMQDIQPKMKELQEKYKGNPEKLNKELANLYKEAGVNPLAGCLPLLVQMPFLISIFFAIRDYQYAQLPPSFLWLPDLAQPDPTYILPVLSALTTYIQQKQTTTEMTQQNKMMLIFMPLFIGYISLTFPGGLVLYWVVSNTFQIAQQWFMYRNNASVTREEAR